MATATSTSEKTHVLWPREIGDRLWFMGIGAVAFAFVVSVVAILVGFLTEGMTTPEETAIVSSDVVLAVFTAALGFLTGLFAPSPVEEKRAERVAPEPTPEAAGFAPVPEPTRRAAASLWYLVVGVFSFALAAAVVVLVIGFFAAGDGDSFVVEAGTLLAVLTAAVGFLAGIFVPSPVESGK
jgi:hypothetical protein